MSRQATVLHADLDAFYVSMELLRRPELRGKPVIVAGGLGARGVVNTCSYEARKYGVRSAMPVGRARQLCPHAEFLASDYRYYAPASKQFHAILRDYTPVVEPRRGRGVHGVRGTELLFGDATAIAKEIRRRISEEIGITASIGVSVNKLVSKVARMLQPDGLVVLPGMKRFRAVPHPPSMVGRRLPPRLRRQVCALSATGGNSRAPESKFAGMAELHDRACQLPCTRTAAR
jgi:DNA polymerase-4